MDDVPVRAALEGVVVVDVRVRGGGPARRARQLAEVLVELGADRC